MIFTSSRFLLTPSEILACLSSPCLPGSSFCPSSLLPLSLSASIFLRLIPYLAIVLTNPQNCRLCSLLIHLSLCPLVAYFCPRLLIGFPASHFFIKSSVIISGWCAIHLPLRLHLSLLPFQPLTLSHVLISAVRIPWQPDDRYHTLTWNLMHLYG